MQGKRINGFSRPLNYIQIVSWVLFSCDLLIFSIFTVPYFSITHIVILSVFLLPLLIVLGFCWYKASAIDPGDTGKSKSQLFCNFCLTYVDTSSKHCRACNKCVENFDHHCKLLNNCIGKHNYQYFLALTSSFSLLSLLTSVYSLLFIISYFEGRSYIYSRTFSSAISLKLVVALNIFLSLSLFCAFICSFILVMMHIYLCSKNLTTFELIKLRNQSNSMNTEESKVEKNTARDIEITKITPEI